MSKINIITNYHWRPILCFYELTKKEQKEMNDNMDNAEEHFYVRYKKTLYPLSNFVKWNTPWTGNKPKEFEYWDGKAEGTAFSCTLIKLSDCGDACQIAHAWSV